MLKLREQIQSDAFQLCSRCYLVNLRYVTALKGNVLTVGRYTLQVSRTRKKRFYFRSYRLFGRELLMLSHLQQLIFSGNLVEEFVIELLVAEAVFLQAPEQKEKVLQPGLQWRSS